MVATILWPRRRLLLGAVAIPLLLWQWIPAVGSVIKDQPDPSKDQTFFQPLVSYLRGHSAQPAESRSPRPRTTGRRCGGGRCAAGPRLGTPGRHRRERNLYPPAQPTEASYHSWLVDHGVTWVGCQNLTLANSGKAEAALIERGLSYLRPAWSDTNWQVWQVIGSSGMVDGPGHLVSLGPKGSNWWPIGPEPDGQGSLHVVLVHHRGASRVLPRRPNGWTACR